MSVDRRFALLRHDHGTGSPEAFDLSGAANTDFITYNSTTGKWEATTDRFDMSGAADGDLLQYNSGTGLWEPYTLAAIPARPNLLVNGSLQIWQNLRSVVGATSAAMITDNWRFEKLNAAVVNISQADHGGGSPEIPAPYYIKVDVTTADASEASTDYMNLITFIEGRDIAPYQWGTAKAEDFTLSFWHAHTKTGINSVTFANSANNRSYTAEYTQSASDTWEKATITVPGDTTGTWLEGAGTGLRVRFSFMCGSAFDASANDTWIAAAAWGSADQINNMDSTSNKIRLGPVKVEHGDTATAMVATPFAEELHKCQRYWWKSYDYDTAPGTGTIAGSGRHYKNCTSAEQRSETVNMGFGQAMRVAPTLTGYSTVTGTAGKIRDTVSAQDITCNFPGTGNMWSADPWGQQYASNTSLNFQVHVVADARMT